MNIEMIKENTWGMILKFSIPSIIAMVLSSMVTIVDGIFVSNFVGEEALAAINLGLPILYIFLGIGIMIGVGGVSIAGRNLGGGKIDKALNVFNQTIITGVIILFISSILFYLGLEGFLDIFKVSSETKVRIIEYYSIVIWVYPFMMMNIIFGMFLRCEGKHSRFMINTMITTLFNILLDYLLINKFNYGVSGAAYATGVSVVIGTLLMIMSFKSKITLFAFKKTYFDKDVFSKTILNGSSEFIGQISLSITMFFLNLVVLKRLGIAGVAAMTIIGYSRYVYNMITTGFGQGFSPMVSFSFGAGEYELCDKLRRYTSKIVLGLGLLFFFLLSIFGADYGRLFTDNTELIQLISGAFLLFSFSFITSGYNDISSFYFTSVGNAKDSAIISSLRGLILLMINIFLLPFLFKDSGIWLIATVTETSTFIVSITLIKRFKKSGKHIKMTTRQKVIM